MQKFLPLVLVLAFLCIFPTPALSGIPCNDGNAVTGDGCSGGSVEDGWLCSGTPAICNRVVNLDFAANAGIFVFLSFGGFGGGTGTYPCGQFEMIVGYRARDSVESGNTVNTRLQVICRTVGASTSTNSLVWAANTNNNYLQETGGNFGSGSLREVLCPQNTFVYSIRGNTVNNFLATLGIYCATYRIRDQDIFIDTPATFVGDIGNTQFYASMLTPVAAATPCVSPSKMFAQTTQIRSGAWIDGITSYCRNSPGFIKCGDGLIQGLEQCDDGNSINGDGCTNLCIKEFADLECIAGQLCTFKATGAVIGLPFSNNPILTIKLMPAGTFINVTADNGYGTASFTIKGTIGTSWDLVLSTPLYNPSGTYIPLPDYQCFKPAGAGSTFTTANYKYQQIFCKYQGPAVLGEYCSEEALYEPSNKRLHNSDGTCLIMLNYRDTRNNHEETCQKIGGNTASMQSQAEQTAIETFIRNASPRDRIWSGITCPATAPRCQQSWSASVLSWVSGEPMRYIPNPPIRSTDNCACDPDTMEQCININPPDGQYRDDACGVPYVGLCKRMPGQVSSDSTLTHTWTGVTMPLPSPAISVTFTIASNIPLGKLDRIAIGISSRYTIFNPASISVSSPSIPGTIAANAILNWDSFFHLIWVNRTSNSAKVNPNTQITLSFPAGTVIYPYWEPSLTARVSSFFISIYNVNNITHHIRKDFSSGPINPVCGDGIVSPPETCDDANNLAGDGCSPMCVVEPSGSCTDGNAVSGDGCSAAGAIEPGYVCPTPGQPCLYATGAFFSLAASLLNQTSPRIGGTTGTASPLTCGPNDLVVGITGKFCTHNVSPTVAGPAGDLQLHCIRPQIDHVTGNLLWTGTTTTLSTKGPACPNPRTDSFNLKCAQNTYITGYRGFVENGAFVRALQFSCGTIRMTKGKLFQQPPIESAALLVQHSSYNAGTPSSTFTKWYFCPENLVLANTANFFTGNAIDSLTWTCVTPRIVACGDNIYDAALEGCDDGNLIDSPIDGCSDTCQVETNWACFGNPSTCVAGCGNYLVANGETCDDGNLINGDGCRSDCSPEPCSDGNTVSGDGCSSTGVIENGYVCPVAGSPCRRLIGRNAVANGIDLAQIAGTGANTSLPIAVKVTDTCGTNQQIVGFEGWFHVEGGGLYSVGKARPICGFVTVSPTNGTVMWTSSNTTTLTYRGTFTDVAYKQVLCPTTQFVIAYRALSYASNSILGGLELTCASYVVSYGNFTLPNQNSNTTLVFAGTGVTSSSPGWTSSYEQCAPGSIFGASVNWWANNTSGGVYGFQGTCASPVAIICGNSVFSSAEQCEDGNAVSGDGCSKECKIESGFACNTVSGLSVCNPLCGDGVVLGQETCDDLNAVNGDGCSSTCQQETGYCCLGQPGVNACKLCPVILSAPPASTEGDQYINITGQNFFNSSSINVTINGISCAGPGAVLVAVDVVSCLVPAGSGSALPILITVNGRVGGNKPGSLQYSYLAPQLASVVPASLPSSGGPVTIIGSNFGVGATRIVTIDGRTCDTPTKLNATALKCTASGWSGNNLPVTMYVDGRVTNIINFTYSNPTILSLVPTSIPAFTTVSVNITLSTLGIHLPRPHYLSLAATPADCANNRLNLNVEITSETFSFAMLQLPQLRQLSFCYSMTTPQRWYPLPSGVFVQLCGSGTIEAPELCDDGNLVNNDGCNSACNVELGYNCTGTPSLCSLCGDSKTTAPVEQCDDGNAISGDGCSATCKIEAGFICRSNPTVPGLSMCNNCGNSILEPPEVCDDGNVGNGDGCSNNCGIEPKWECIGGLGAKSNCHNCGNGLLEIQEGCDDGNNVKGDGCDDLCRPETGFLCFGYNPSVCQKCQNGRREGSESCDDGNNVQGDGCSTLCAVEEGYACSVVAGAPDRCFPVGCGDGIVACTEQCDDHNLVSGDGCTNDCKIEGKFSCSGSPSVCQLCGNGRVEGTEQCDDGNLNVEVDGCTSLCAINQGWSCVSFPTKTNTSVCSPPLDSRSVLKAYPLSGPISGKSVVVLVGSGLSDSFSPLYCVFGGVGKVLSRVSGEAVGGIECVAPALTGVNITDFYPVPFTVVDDNGKNIPITGELYYHYYPLPTIISLLPRSIETAAGTPITITGSGFVNTSLLSPSIAGSALVLVRRFTRLKGLQTTNTTAAAAAADNSTAAAGAANATTSGGSSSGSPSVNIQFSVIAAIPATYVSPTEMVAISIFRPPGDVEVGFSNNFVNEKAYSVQVDTSQQIVLRYRVCLPGTVSSSIESRCRPCGPGTFQSLDGQTECQRCPKTQYTARNQSSICDECPAGSTSSNSVLPPSSITDCECAAGFYDPEGVGKGVICKKCKEGGYCDGGATQPIPSAGYWVDPSDPTSEFLPCKSNTACPGGIGSVDQPACGPGYIGIRCGACAPGFYSMNGECMPCPKNRSSRFYLFAFGIIILTVIAVLVTRQQGKQRQLLSTFTIANSFAQCLGIVFSMDLRWPNTVKEVVGLATFPFNLNMDLVATECTVAFGFDGKWYFTLMLPFFFAFLLATIFAISTLAMYFRMIFRLRKARAERGEGTSGATAGAGATSEGEEEPDEELLIPKTDKENFLAGVRHMRQGLVNAFFLLISILYLVLSQACLVLFDCTERNAAGLSFLDSVPSRQCYDKWWWKRVPVAIFFIFVYVIGIPCGLWLLVYFSLRRAKLKRITFLRYFGSISGKYKTQFPAWEGVVMLRKLAIVVGKNMFTVLPLLQALCALSAVVIGLSAHIQFHPMQQKRMNTLETVLLGCSTAVLLAGVFLGGSNFPDGGLRQRAVVAAVITVIAVGAATLLGAVITEIWMASRPNKFLREKLGKDEVESVIVPGRSGTVLKFLRDDSVIQDDRDSLHVVLVSLIKSENLSEADARAAGIISKAIHSLVDGWVRPTRFDDICRWLIMGKESQQRMFVRSFARMIAYASEETDDLPAYEKAEAVLMNSFLATLGDGDAGATPLLHSVVARTLLAAPQAPLRPDMIFHAKGERVSKGRRPSTRLGRNRRGSAETDGDDASGSDEGSEDGSGAKEETAAGAGNGSNQSEEGTIFEMISKFSNQLFSPREPATVEPKRRGSVLDE